MSAIRLLLPFFKSVVWSSWKKPILKTKWQKLINQQVSKCFYLNAARGYEKKSLKYVIKPVLQTCAEQLISGVKFEIDTDIKSSPIWISCISKHVIISINLTTRQYDIFQFHVGQFSYQASCKGCLIFLQSPLPFHLAINFNFIPSWLWKILKFVVFR